MTLKEITEMLESEDTFEPICGTESIYIERLVPEVGLGVLRIKELINSFDADATRANGHISYKPKFIISGYRTHDRINNTVTAVSKTELAKRIKEINK